MTSLNALESEVIRMLLAGGHEWLCLLRRQAYVLKVENQTMTGAGFVTRFSVPEEVRRLPGNASFRLGDVSADISGLRHGAGFILWIRDGVLDSLEGYSYEESWPAVITSFRVYYTGDSKRDEDALVRYISSAMSKDSPIH